ncbi:MAG TPA: PQQ-dependent sugar dehydrogenase [Reyranella sp.]|jgi:glucose/arabinose dehydrogenase|nr:PQQ-dependent sugar dehydrogenase [Reyranella sp.]
MNRRRFILTASASALPAPALAQNKAAAPLRSAKAAYRLVTLASGLVQPWSIAFLPDGRMLITERPGRLRVFADGRLEPRALAGVPEVYAAGQAGLLDVCLHPDFARNRVLYLSYVDSGQGGAATAVARAELTDAGLKNTTRIFEALPRRPGSLNLGSRIVFDRAGLMYVSCGDRFQMQQAQDLGDLAGKIVRLKEDGSVPADNPFVGRQNARPEIFSWGHRNPQGLAMHPETGKIWEVEHGPKGGDELNILKAGANYGWPVVTYGTNYDGSIITNERHRDGMEDALRTWVPSISPCGLAFYTGDKFPGWKGSLFTGGLSAEHALHRIELDGEKYRGEERLLEDHLPYIRDVRQGPDGLLYLVTQSGNGGLYRLEPA